MGALWLYLHSLHARILISTGFCPSDSLEKAQADMIFDGVEDLRVGMSKFYFEKDEAKKVGTCVVICILNNVSCQHDIFFNVTQF